VIFNKFTKTNSAFFYRLEPI